MPSAPPNRALSAELSATRSYEWWQEQLAEEFFSPDHGGRPVIFFINKDEAERLRSGSPDRVGDLETTVNASLNWQGAVFEPVVRRVERWKGTAKDSPPPCLPLLAAAVLAASEMHRSAGVPSHNYYKRLAEILRPPHSRGGDHTGLLKNSYPEVVALWLELDRWLVVSSGMRGVSTIRTARTQQRSRIGYAQSQVLVRASDLDDLTHFFQRTGTSSGTSADPDRLLKELRIWSSARHVFSARLQEALRSGDDDEVLGPLLTALAEANRPSAGVGTRRLPLLLAAEEVLIAGWQLRWHAPVLEGVHEDVLRYNGSEFAISASAGALSYTLSGSVPEPAAVLSRGLKAQGNRVCARIEPGRHVIAMREDPVAGGWVETQELAAFEPYLLLVDETGEQRMRAVARQAGLPWYDLEETSVEGWFALPEVTTGDIGILGQLATATGLTQAASAAPARPRLVGGFRVRTDLSLRCYLLGGEPDVILPPSSDGTTALLDGQPLEENAETPVALRGRRLAAGKHQIETSGGRLQFSLEPPYEQRPPTGRPQPSDPQAGVTVFLPYGRKSWFIKADGSFISVRTGDEPAWWSGRSTGLQSGGPFEVQVPEEAVWLVTFQPNQPSKVVQLRDTSPSIGRLSHQMKESWRGLVLDEQRGTPHFRLWRRYREAVLAGMPKQVFRRV